MRGREYQTLENLRAHYIGAGDTERARWAEDELLQFHRIAKQEYIVELGPAPAAPPKGIDKLLDADLLYTQALNSRTKGRTKTSTGRKNCCSNS